MPELVQIVLLGVIQGVAEFLPISSSGHLALAAWLFGFHEDQLGVAIWLHAGTLAATCVVYHKELRDTFRQPRMMLLLGVAMVPAGLVGLAFKAYIDTIFQSITLVGFCFCITALALFLGEWQFRRVRTTSDSPGPGGALWVGLAQAVALLPGVSRSGMTISAGLACGLNRLSAARFSFLLSIPTIFGASLVEAVHAFRQGGYVALNATSIMCGVAVSFVVGLMSLRALLALLRRRPVHVFAAYCLFMGLVTLALAATLTQN